MDDPEFMEEFMSNHDHLSHRSKNYNTLELPIIPAEDKLLKRQDKLKNQINEVLGTAKRTTTRLHSTNMSHTSGNNRFDLGRTGESGINFFN